MIELFEIFSTSGEVLFKYQQRRVPEAVINSFISTTFVSQRENLIGINNHNHLSKNDKDDYDDDLENDVVNTYNGDIYSIKYIKTVNPTLIFILAYPSVIHLHNTEDLLLKLKTLFVEMFGDEVTANFSRTPTELIDFNSANFAKYEQFFNIQLQQYNTVQKNSSLSTTSAIESPNELTPTPHSKLTKKQQALAQKKSNNKKSRKWGADGSLIEEDYNDNDDEDGNLLDFSALATPIGKNPVQDDLKIQQLVGNTSTFGNKTKSGNFLVSDLGQEMDRILANSKNSSSGSNNKSKNVDKSSDTSTSLGFLKNYLGGKKITKDDVNQIAQTLTNHLIKKNVAPEVSRNLVANVEKNLIGSTTKSFTSLEKTAKDALTDALTTLLTPNTSIDLLNEIQKKRNSKEPYVISVVGVNGVGKSTNLSKLAFWLLQNDYKVLITACDTFRSGAVEQLRVHVNNLKHLTSESDEQIVELFEGGYGGADLVSKIAKGAIKYAKEKEFDIVLMDTAGRRHNDTKLMAPLLSFAKAANPDKIIMVGEALVGTDSVMQAQNFNKLFGVGRKLDCFIISKCDTVGDLIGSMVNMVYATGIPILFVGTGQTYTDLRTLSVEWAVNMLMS